MNMPATFLPDNPIIWFDKANDLRDLKRFPEALMDYRSCTFYLTLHWQAHGIIEEMYLAAMHLYEDALSSYEQALQFKRWLNFCLV